MHEHFLYLLSNALIFVDFGYDWHSNDNSMLSLF